MSRETARRRAAIGQKLSSMHDDVRPRADMRKSILAPNNRSSSPIRFPYLGDAAIEVVGVVSIYMFGRLGKSKKRKPPS